MASDWIAIKTPAVPQTMSRVRDVPSKPLFWSPSEAPEQMHTIFLQRFPAFGGSQVATKYVRGSHSSDFGVYNKQSRPMDSGRTQPDRLASILDMPAFGGGGGERAGGRMCAQARDGGKAVAIISSVAPLPPGPWRPAAPSPFVDDCHASCNTACGANAFGCNAGVSCSVLSPTDSWSPKRSRCSFLPTQEIAKARPKARTVAKQARTVTKLQAKGSGCNDAGRKGSDCGETVSLVVEARPQAHLTANAGPKAQAVTTLQVVTTLGTEESGCDETGCKRLEL